MLTLLRVPLSAACASLRAASQASKAAQFLPDAHRPMARDHSREGFPDRFGIQTQSAVIGWLEAVANRGQYLMAVSRPIIYVPLTQSNTRENSPA
jgi:hypothetical protein